MGDWSRGMILVSGTRGPGFNSRIALIFTNLSTNSNKGSFFNGLATKVNQKQLIIIPKYNKNSTLQIIQLSKMKSSLSNSYYMGISYRSTHRPTPSHPLTTFSFSSISKSQQFDNIEQQFGEQQKIIHTIKNKKKVKEILRHYNPYIVRKECDLKNKRKKHQEKKNDAEVQEARSQFLKVKKIETSKGGDVNQQSDCLGKISVQIALPEKTKVRGSTSASKQKRASTDKIITEKQSIIAQPIFTHFPSQLFVSSTKSGISQSKLPSQKLSNFFFPSRRVKTQYIDSVNNSQDRNKKGRPTSSQPRKKLSHDNRIFNFDGTLQNYRICIPERPKTADHRMLGKFVDKKRSIHYLSYDQIAKRCIKLKKQKDQRGPKIQPWLDQESKNNIDLFQISCSSIRADQSEIL